MLIQRAFANKLKAFILKVNKTKQEDIDKAIDAFCKEQEEDVYEAIRSLTITIPPGSIIVATSTGPATNPAPIILNGVVS